MSQEAERADEQRGRSPAELATLVISIAIVAAVAITITVLYVRGQETPPMLRAEPRLEQVWQTDDRFNLPVIVSNDGDRTAEEVSVEAELVRDGETETAAFTLAFLAGRDKGTGFVLFASDPRDGELTVKVTSFREP